MVKQISSTKSTRLPIEIWTKRNELTEPYNPRQDRKINSDHISIELQETRFDLFSRLSGRTWFPVKMSGSVSVENDSDALQNDDMTAGPETSTGRLPPRSTAPKFPLPMIHTIPIMPIATDPPESVSSNVAFFKVELHRTYLQGLLSSGNYEWNASATSKRIPIKG
jgi:hypothetical protein